MAAGRRLPRFGFTTCPAVPAALWLGDGVLLGLLILLPPGGRWLAGGLGVAGAVALWWLGTPPVRRAAWLTAVGGALALWHVWAPWRTYRQLLPRDTRGGEIRAVVVDPGYVSDELFWLARRGGCRIRVTAFRPAGAEAFVACRGVLLLQSAATPPAPYGSRILCTGRFERPADGRLPFEFDYATYLRSVRIEHLFVADQVVIEGDPRGWRRMMAAAYTVRATLVERLVQGIDGREPAGIAAAMLFGYREGLTPALQQAFKRSGTIHIIAISGLHVAIAAAVFQTALALAGVPFRLRHAVLPAIVGAYVFLAGGAPSAVRAWIMIGIWCACRASLRPTPAFNSLAVSAFVLLAWNPLNLLNKGFQFSFLVVAFLSLGWRWISEILGAFNETDLWQPPHCRPPARRWRRRVMRWVVPALATSAVSWLGSLGMVAWTNGIVSPAGFPANLAACGLSWCALWLAPVKLLTGFLGPAVADGIVGGCLGRCLVGIQAGAQWAAREGTCLVVGQPHALLVVAYSAVLLVLLAPGMPARVRAALAGVWLALLAAIVLPVQWPRQPSVTVLSGGGSLPCIAVEPGGRLPPLALGGGDPLTARRLESWLVRNGYDRLQYLILTGGARGAAGGAERLVTNLFVASLIVPATSSGDAGPAVVPRLSATRPHLRAAVRAQIGNGRRVRCLARTDTGGQTLEHGALELDVGKSATTLQLASPGAPIRITVEADPLAGARLRADVGGQSTERFVPFTLRPAVARWRPGWTAWETIGSGGGPDEP